jgi:hypothetical protein
MFKSFDTYFHLVFFSDSEDMRSLVNETNNQQNKRVKA